MMASMLLAAVLALAATFIDLPGRPFSAIPSKDGARIFLTLSNRHGVAVVRNGAVEQVIETEGGLTGAVLTHDGKLLIASMDNRVAFIDVARMAVAGYLPLPPPAAGRRIGAVYVNVDQHDRYLYVSDEYALRITVVDLRKARKNGYKATAIVGAIPTGPLPIALTFSPDGKFLYTTSESASPEWNWTPECKPENPNAPNQALRPQGAMVIIDTKSREVVDKLPAGCSAVRLALSPDGKTAYVTARNWDAVTVFDIGSRKQIAKIPVGSAPVGIAVVDKGRKIVVANSNRFAADPASASTLTVIDSATLKVTGSLPSGGFPRELHLSNDQKTLLVTNFASKSLQLIEVATLP